MSQTITFPLPTGSNYVIPDVGDENWGQNVTNFLVAIPNGVMPTSGTFTLTGDVSFGPTFGLVSQYFKSATVSPASAGFLRLAKTDSLAWRNNLNSANLLLAIDGSDNLIFNGLRILTPTVSVSDGGTGDTSFTAYSVICGGITSTGALQSVASVGISGQFLQSQGPGMLPTWANAAGTGTVNSGIAGNLSLYAASTNTVSDTYVQNTKNITIGIASQTGRTVDLALTIPNPGNAVAAASIVLTQGAQTLAGPYTFGTNQVTFPNGSALLPSICFSGSNTTGFDYAAGTVQVAISAAQVFQFTSSENRSYQPLSMQSQKITSLANATATDDATAFGQVQYGFQNAFLNTNFSATSTTSTSYVNTGLSSGITPTSASSRIKITVSGYGFNVPSGSAHVTLARNGVDLSTGGVGFARIVSSSGSPTLPVSFTFIDSPATTSAVTYTVRIKLVTGAGPVIWNQATGEDVMILEELR